LKISFLPFKGRIKVGMGIKRPLYKPILTPALSLKEREVGCRMLIGVI
jgi:hypothetical protein